MRLFPIRAIFLRQRRTHGISLFDLSVFLSPGDAARVDLAALGQPCVSVHVRRGDYVGNELFDIGNLQAFYRRALREIMSETQNACILVFTDDPEWCANWTVVREFNAHVVGGPNRRPSGLGSHGVVSVSSRTPPWPGGPVWLAADPMKTVRLPSQWLNKWTTRECGLSVPGWIEIEIPSTNSCAGRGEAAAISS